MAISNSSSNQSCVQQSQLVEGIMSCTICLGHVDDPRILPCSHTFCLRCIHNAAASNQDQFNCPMQDGFKIERDDIDSLPVNRDVREMVEVLPVMIGEFDEDRATIIPNIQANARWAQNGVTVAGGHGRGSGTNQLDTPHGFNVSENQTVYIADLFNHRIVEWKPVAASGEVVAGGNGYGNRADQLHRPTGVIVDKETDSLIICDRDNKRVVRWSRQSGTSGETIIDSIHCTRLTMDDQRFLYISGGDRVTRYRMGETNGTVVAGGNGQGDSLNQLNFPTYVFVDRDQSVYVSDRENHRVMKWVKGAKEGTVVAGGQGQGNDLTQLSYPYGVFVDSLDTVYVADNRNHRVMRWCKGVKEGTVIVGGNGEGQQANQFDRLEDLSFDRQGNLYVVDCGNARVQRFLIE